MMPMRIHRRFVPVALGATFLLAACSAADNRAAGAPVARDSAGVRIVESAASVVAEGGGASPIDLELTPSVIIGIEEGEEAYQLNRVFDAHRMPDGRIAIGNSGSYEVRVYDAAGKHVKNVGRQGSGPNEYSELSSIYLHAVGDTLVVTDGGAFRVNVLGPDLEFVETRRFTLTADVGRPFLQGVFADGSWLVMAFEGGGRSNGPPGSVLESRFSLLRYDRTGAPLDTLATFAGRKRYVNEVNGITHYPYIPLTADPLQAVSGNELVTLRGDKAELEYRDQQGRLVRLVRWPRERKPSAEVWPAFKERSIAGLATGDERNRVMYTAYYAKELPLPEFAPLYAAMRVDADRRVWLERFRLPGDSVRTWDIIEYDGAWLGTVITPPRMNLHRIGKDYLLGRSLDSLGVERVQLHPFKWRDMP
jgi:hypothetical protein